MDVERGENLSLASGHRLLPQERWFASWILERQRTHRTPEILRTEQNYGPEGIALWAAAVITVFPGQLIVVSGIAFMLASGGTGTLLTMGYSLDGFGVFLCLLGSIRAFQGSRAGRAFRDGRPVPEALNCGSNGSATLHQWPLTPTERRLHDLRQRREGHLNLRRDQMSATTIAGPTGSTPGFADLRPGCEQQGRVRHADRSAGGRRDLRVHHARPALQRQRRHLRLRPCGKPHHLGRRHDPDLRHRQPARLLGHRRGHDQLHLRPGLATRAQSSRRPGLRPPTPYDQAQRLTSVQKGALYLPLTRPVRFRRLTGLDHGWTAPTSVVVKQLVLRGPSDRRRLGGHRQRTSVSSPPWNAPPLRKRWLRPLNTWRRSFSIQGSKVSTTASRLKSAGSGVAEFSELPRLRPAGKRSQSNAGLASSAQLLWHAEAHG